MDRMSILQTLEAAGRTCYKSEDKITDDSCVRFVDNLVKRKHLPMIEFFDIVVKFIHNRGFSHEMVRHRLCSFAQESTRYVDYGGEGITVIEPYWENIDGFNSSFVNWKNAMCDAEYAYMNLRKRGLSPQMARGVLPLDIKTEIVVKANLREWIHIFNMRCAPSAHPDMQRVMIPLRKEFREVLPEIYGEKEKEL
jgi:thymidylate synthase (FAD)